MYICYEDILRRIAEPPKWWLKGVPRYDDFSPDEIDVYASRVALVHTKCVCGRDYLQGVQFLREEDVARLAEGTAGLGDPPNACWALGDSLCSNASTSCREIRVLQFWRKVPSGGGQKWERQPQYEVELHDWFES